VDGSGLQGGVGLRQQWWEGWRQPFPTEHAPAFSTTSPWIRLEEGCSEGCMTPAHLDSRD